jgi:hypothetical protein
VVTQRKERSRPAQYIEELQELVRERFPEAEFEVHRIGPKEYNIRVYGDFDNLYDVLDLTGVRAEDILVDHGIFIHVLPLGRRISPS